MNRIQITANDKTFSIPSGQSLGEFLRQSGFETGTVVVERNQTPVSPGETGRVLLADGDRLEIVRIVAGG